MSNYIRGGASYKFFFFLSKVNCTNELFRIHPGMVFKNVSRLSFYMMLTFYNNKYLKSNNCPGGNSEQYRGLTWHFREGVGFRQ